MQLIWNKGKCKSNLLENIFDLTSLQITTQCLYTNITNVFVYLFISIYFIPFVIFSFSFFAYLYFMLYADGVDARPSSPLVMNGQLPEVGVDRPLEKNRERILPDQVNVLFLISCVCTL